MYQVFFLMLGHLLDSAILKLSLAGLVLPLCSWEMFVFPLGSLSSFPFLVDFLHLSSVGSDACWGHSVPRKRDEF